jgi:hypothetical protein
MTKPELKMQIENLAQEESISFMEACSAIQGAAAKMGNEEIIGIVHEMKMESLGL